jgi:hypothetical protein
MIAAEGFVSVMDCMTKCAEPVVFFAERQHISTTLAHADT